MIAPSSMRILLPSTAAAMLIGSMSATATDYYVDPLTGNMSNDGSAASPWSTLAAVASGKTFLPGDHIYLRRGDHGTASITGVNTGDVFIEPEPGHTPVVRLSMINAHHWYIKGLTIPGGVAIDNQTNENSDDNTFENCYLPSGGFSVCGNRITLRGNHIRAGGIHFLYHSNSGLVSGNTIEDFYSDAMNMKGNSNVFENNLVMNSHKVSGNHNDMFQGWATTGNVVRGNEFRAYSDPNQPDLIAPGVSDVQGIGLFDGFYTNWVIENNVVFVDHPIGIWIHGAKGCLVKNNTVVRCGQYSLFPYLYSPERFPNIKVSATKSGAASSGNVVINNASERFELADADNAGLPIGTTMNNLVVPKNAFASTFLDWAHKDLHVQPGASIIDAGTSTNSPPATDADGNARPFGLAWDCGAFEFGYPPSSADTTGPSKPVGLTAVIIPGFGVDLHWSPATDNRKVAGYDIYRNGVWLDLPVKPHGGRTRAGTNYLDLTATTTGSYTVQAFDHSGNRSPMSDPIGGTPPAPDTQPPTAPAGAAATPQSTTAMRITWSASTDNVGVTGYDVWRDGNKVGSSGATSYMDTGLSPSTLYSYTITATDFAGNVSDASTPATGTTLAPDLTPPSVPANVRASAMSSGSIQVTWSASTDNRGVTGYQVYRDGALIDTLTETSYADTGLVAMTSYSYTVKALDADGNASAPSTPPATATTMEPAAVLVEETFDSYTVGNDISGKSGGIGWTTNWAVTKGGMDTVVAGNVSGVGTGNALGQSYNATTPQASRSFTAINNGMGRTLWLAFELQANAVKSTQTLNLSGSGFSGNMITIGTGGSWVPPTYQFYGTTVVTPATTAAQRFVVRLDIVAGGSTTMTCYVNPNLNTDATNWTPAAVSSQPVTSITGILFRSNTNSATQADKVNLDNIRLATTWQGAVGQPVTTPIQTWRQTNFGTTDNDGIAADGEDPNHNGVINLLEYALGGDPLGNTTGTAILPQARRGTSGQLQIRFTRYLDRVDLTLVVQAADSPLGQWADIATSAAGAAFAPTSLAAETGTGNTRNVTVSDIYQTNDPAHPKRFMRLKVVN